MILSALDQYSCTDDFLTRWVLYRWSWSLVVEQMHESTRKREVELSNYHKGETKTSLKKKVKDTIEQEPNLVLRWTNLDVSHKLYTHNEAVENLDDGFLHSRYELFNIVSIYPRETRCWSGNLNGWSSLAQKQISCYGCCACLSKHNSQVYRLFNL